MRRGSYLNRHTPLSRTVGIRRTTEITRGGRLPPVNRKRKTDRDDRNFGAEADRVRVMPCLITGTVPSEPAHVTSRGAGGGRFDLVPLSPAIHEQQHGVGIESFQACHKLDLRAEADRIAVMHPEPLGIRGLARRWVAAHAWRERQEVIFGAPLDDYEREALFGWVRRRMERAGSKPSGEHVSDIAEALGLSNEEAFALCTAAREWRPS